MIAVAVGLSQSRVRRLYADAVSPAPRYTPDEAGILANVRAFLEEATAAGTPTSRRAYEAWAGRIASPATVVTRFVRWSWAVRAVRRTEAAGAVRGGVGGVDAAMTARAAGVAAAG